MPEHDDYEVPAGWPSRDLVAWINATLAEEGVESVEVFRGGDGLTLRVHKRKRPVPRDPPRW